MSSSDGCPLSMIVMNNLISILCYLVPQCGQPAKISLENWGRGRTARDGRAGCRWSMIQGVCCIHVTTRPSGLHAWMSPPLLSPPPPGCDRRGRASSPSWPSCALSAAATTTGFAAGTQLLLCGGQPRAWSRRDSSPCQGGDLVELVGARRARIPGGSHGVRDGRTLGQLAGQGLGSGLCCMRPYLPDSDLYAGTCGFNRLEVLSDAAAKSVPRHCNQRVCWVHRLTPLHQSRPYDRSKSEAADGRPCMLGCQAMLRRDRAAYRREYRRRRSHGDLRPRSAGCGLAPPFPGRRPCRPSAEPLRRATPHRSHVDPPLEAWRPQLAGCALASAPPRGTYLVLLDGIAASISVASGMLIC